jgi:hypothetical protein
MILGKAAIVLTMDGLIGRQGDGKNERGTYGVNK